MTPCLPLVLIITSMMREGAHVRYLLPVSSQYHIPSLPHEGSSSYPHSTDKETEAEGG